VPNRIELDLKNALSLSSQYIPVLIMLPDQENTFVNVTNEIIKFGIEKSIDQTKIIIITIDNDKLKLKRLNVALNEAIRLGHWIVIENAHLLNEWPDDILRIIYVSFYHFYF